MKAADKKSLFLKPVQNFLFHALFISTTILLLFILVLPTLLKSNLLFNSDLAFHAREIWELMQGRSLFYYYEEVNFHGILEGLAAIPFLKFMGVYPVSYSLPAIIFYGLVIWTTFLILRYVNPTSGWIASIFLLLPPSWVTHWVIAQNNLYSLIIFLGNLTLLYTIKIKLAGETPFRTAFFLGFFSGLAVYAYTYSIIYIFTVALILTLTHPQWNHIRTHLTAKNLIQSFKNLGTKSQYLNRIIDIIITLFLLAIIYSYIFGGFGLDIGGVTLLQINNLHKPVIQVAVLITIRLIVFRTNTMNIIQSLKSYYQTVNPHTKNITIIGAVGFILGIFPRIISILSGSVARGGQGFDVDFSPIRIILHTFETITAWPIKIMALGEPLSILFFQNSVRVFSSTQAVLVLPITCLAGFAIYFFIVPRWALIKKIVRLETLTFDPTLILLVLPATLCAFTIIMKDGAYLRHLYPLYWIITIYAALLISRISNYSRILALTLIGLWITFYAPAPKSHFIELQRWREILSPNAESPIPHVVEFLKSIGIKAVYSDYGTASEIIMYSNGEIQAAQYNKSARGKSLQAKLKNQPNFALATTEQSLAFILGHLDDHEISYKKKLVHSLSYEGKVHSYWVIWDLKGNASAVNQLRYIFD